MNEMTLMLTYQRAATCFLEVRGAKRDLWAISLEGVDIETSYHALSSTSLFIDGGTEFEIILLALKF